MGNLMTSAEIKLWDFIVPIESCKSKNVSKKYRKQILKNQGSTIRKADPVEKVYKIVDNENSSFQKSRSKKTIQTQFFMLFSTSLIGFFIGIMVSLLL